MQGPHWPVQSVETDHDGHCERRAQTAARARKGGIPARPRRRCCCATTAAARSAPRTALHRPGQLTVAAKAPREPLAWSAAASCQQAAADASPQRQPLCRRSSSRKRSADIAPGLSPRQVCNRGFRFGRGQRGSGAGADCGGRHGASGHVLSTNVTIWRYPDGVCNFVLARPAADPEPSRWRPDCATGSGSYRNGLLARTRCSAALVLSTPAFESMKSRRPSVEIPTASAWFAPSL